MRQTSVRKQPERLRSRVGQGTLSPRMFIFAMASFTLLGLGWTGICATITEDMTFSRGWHYGMFVLAMFLLAMVGVLITVWSNSTGGSLFGFAIMASGLGLMLGPTLGYYTSSSILTALAGTVCIVVVLGIVGALIPASLNGWLPVLLGLTTAIIFMLFLAPMLAPAVGYDPHAANHLIDWIILVVFGLWVIYDLNDAMQEMSYTTRNAADAAVAIYLDFLNIFLALLDLFGSGGGSSSDWSDDGFWDAVGDFLGALFHILNPLNWFGD